MDNRRFVEAVLWIARTGSPWRDLPAELGNWHTTYTRFSRWCKTGVWRRVPKKAGHQALGRSRGGLSTKIHATVDALGNPLRCLLTGGEIADITQAEALLMASTLKHCWRTRVMTRITCSNTWHNRAPKRSFRPNRTACNTVTTIGICTKTVIWWNAFSIASNNSDASPHAMKNSPAISSLCSISSVPTYGLLDC